MFATACSIAREYTRPMIISYRTFDGKCHSGIGTYVIINDEGWAVTAYHIIEMVQKLQQSNQQYQARLIEREKVLNNDKIKKGEQQRILNKDLKISPDAITNYSVWLGLDNWHFKGAFFLQVVDIAAFQIDGFKGGPKKYPEFKDPDKPMDQGTSLCKLGFPFSQVQPEFKDNHFTLPDAPLPIFPIEGIMTRIVEIQHKDVLPFETLFIETSTPGLRGQSGGPTFDVHGTIWAIQSSTRHLNLGFGGNGNSNAKEKEHLSYQYLNVGWGTHSGTIIGFLKANNIKFNLATY